MRLASVFLTVSCTLASDLSFKTQTIANDLRGGYQIVIADLNHDGKPDLLALASGQDELAWYENPSWKRHVIARGLTGMINCAVVGDDIVVAHGFSSDASKSVGNVSVLHPTGEPDGLWTVREIDRLPTSHRLRVAEMDGRTIVVNAPLTGAAARPPDYRDQVPLVFYRPGEWKRETIDARNFGVQHGILVEGRSIYTASFSGIHRYRLRNGQQGNRAWARTEVSKGEPAACPQCGTSDVAMARDRAMFSIEPWHGNQIVEYRKGRRKVIDDSLSDTHAILAADLDRDGRDEIVVSQRGAPGRVLIYRGNRKIVVDEGIKAASCAIADLDGDGRPDIACIGDVSLKIYWNRQ